MKDPVGSLALLALLLGVSGAGPSAAQPPASPAQPSALPSEIPAKFEPSRRASTTTGAT